MSVEYILAFTFLFSITLLVIQRTERKYRLWMTILAFITGGLFVPNLVAGAVGEAILSFILALFLNLLFWMMVGRYNPVGHSDDKIQVLGMDD